MTLQKNEVFFLNFLKKRWSDVAKSFLSQTSQHGSRRVIGKIDLLAETRIETGVEEGGGLRTRREPRIKKNQQNVKQKGIINGEFVVKVRERKKKGQCVMQMASLAREQLKE